MAHVMRNKIRGLLAAFIALVAAAALVPSAAFAETWTGDDWTGSIEIQGLHEQDATVKLYQIAYVHFDSQTNTTSLVNTSTGDDINFDSEATLTYVKNESAENASALADTKNPNMQATYSRPVIAPADDGTYTATFSDVPAGLYYVEVSGGADSKYAYQDNMIVSLSPTFKDGAWDIQTPATLVAKAATSTVDKAFVINNSNGTTSEANEVDGVVDQKYQFKITFQIPEGRTEFKVNDQMNGFEYTDGMKGIKLYKGKDATGELLADGAEDAISDGIFESVNFTKESEGDDAPINGFTVIFGKAWLDNLSGNDYYTIVYSATLCSHAKPSGATNKVTTSIDDKGETVIAEFGKVGLKKIDEDSKLLPGATFQLFEVTENEDGKKAYNPVKVNNDNVYLTSVDTGDGIKWTNDLSYEPVLQIGKQYALKETKAPTGYVLDANYYDVTACNRSATSKDEGYDSAYATVTNVLAGPGEGINLPKTGGMGTILFTVVGVVIMAGAVGFIVRARKHN